MNVNTLKLQKAPLNTPQTEVVRLWSLAVTSGEDISELANVMNARFPQFATGGVAVKVRTTVLDEPVGVG